MGWQLRCGIEKGGYLLVHVTDHLSCHRHIGLIEEALDRIEGTGTEADRGKKMFVNGTPVSLNNNILRGAGTNTMVKGDEMKRSNDRDRDQSVERCEYSRGSEETKIISLSSCTLPFERLLREMHMMSSTLRYLYISSMRYSSTF